MFKALVVTCFFFVCTGHHYRHVKHFHSAPTISKQAPAPDKAITVPSELRPFGSCDEIGQAYDDFFNGPADGFGTDNHRDKFVARYPANEQRRVLKCLDKSGRGNEK
jgi:hypothetical protein